VIRIKCKDNQKKRKETREKVPYTITILPGFLIPHSRVTIPNLFKAFEGYCNEEITQQQATLLMNCNSRHSFNLYYKRFSSLFYKWITFLAKSLQQHKLEIKEQPVDLKKRWSKFTSRIIRLKIDHIFETSTPVKMFFRLEYAHSLLDGNKMGLGPQ